MILSEANNIKLGSQQIDRVYCGSQIVWEHESLPDGYQRCVYLESDGTSCIDTKIYGTATYVLDIKFEESTSRTLMGYATYVSGYFGKDENNRFELGGNIFISSSLADPVTRNTVTFSYNSDLKTGTLEVNGETISRTGASYISRPFYLFKISGATSYLGKSKIYGAKIYQSDTLVENLIPCLDADRVPCMYDTVSKTPFYNAGTGDFLYELA